MEIGVIELLKDVNYMGPMVEDGRLGKALDEGAKSTDFTQLISWLSLELKSFCSLDEHINPIKSANEVDHFLLETSGFLKELGCPYSDLVEGAFNERLKTRASRSALLTYLLSELQAARMIEANCAAIESTPKSQPDASDSPHNDLKNMLMVLRFTKPPDNISAEALFSKVEARISDVIKTAHPDLFSKPAFKTPLNLDKWKVLAKEQKNLHNEYRIRRELLLTRLHVTVQSFEWSDRLESKQDEMSKVFQAKVKHMPKEPSVDISDLLAARADLLVIEKTSNASVRKNTRSDVNKVMIGKVPDRGGRPSEQSAPPKEMPSWQTNRSTDGGKGGGGGNWRGGGRGGDRGGRGGRGSYHNQQQQQYNEARMQSGQYQQQNDSNNQNFKGGNGGGRVQGGWSQQGSDSDKTFNNSGRGRGGGGRGGGGYGRSRGNRGDRV